MRPRPPPIVGEGLGLDLVDVVLEAPDDGAYPSTTLSRIA